MQSKHLPLLPVQIKSIQLAKHKVTSVVKLPHKIMFLLELNLSGHKAIFSFSVSRYVHRVKT